MIGNMMGMPESDDSYGDEYGEESDNFNDSEDPSDSRAVDASVPLPI
jgi:hypothetical protein